MFYDHFPKDRMPNTLDLQDADRRWNSALEQRDYAQFIEHFKRMQDLKRPFSREIPDQETMLRFCIEHHFMGLKETPQENAAHLWKHEAAHLQVAEEHKIPATIRIAELNEPFHFKYLPYVDLDMNEMTKRFGSNHINLLVFFGEVLLAPQKQGTGYKSETDLGNKFLSLARRARIRKFFLLGK